MEPVNTSSEKVFHCRSNIIKIMKKGGYFDNIMAADSRLDRVKEFLKSFTISPSLNQTSLETNKHSSIPNPRLMPLFPIQNQPIRDDNCLNTQRKTLEEQFQIIKSEALSLDPKEDYFDYGIRDMPKGSWHIHLFSYMGTNIVENCRLCPKTTEILNSLTRRCQVYPWGDAIFSVLEPGAHIPAHYSVDNLRVRCMLGLVVPEGCIMRVGDLKTTWQEGKVLFFEDSFEHEVWHNGKTRRIVLILDFWHPNLTAIEIEAISIGLYHPLIKNELYEFLGNDTEKYNEHLRNTSKEKKMPDKFYDFWNAMEVA